MKLTAFYVLALSTLTAGEDKCQPCAVVWVKTEPPRSFTDPSSQDMFYHYIILKPKLWKYLQTRRTDTIRQHFLKI